MAAVWSTVRGSRRHAAAGVIYEAILEAESLEDAESITANCGMLSVSIGEVSPGKYEVEWHDPDADPATADIP